MNNVMEEEEEEVGVNNNVIIPIILIFEILLLLPVRVLLRFRCVCKEWCELIDSRVFKDTFLALRRRFQDRLFIYKGHPLSCWYGDYQSIVALASAAPVIPPYSSSCSALNSDDDFEIPVEWCEISKINIINHVDGIICLFDDGDYFHAIKEEAGFSFNWLAITLVNPALRQFRKLPIPLEEEFDLLGDMWKRRVQGIGIGYHNNEYNVVAIVSAFENEIQDYDASPYKHVGIVYRLTTNSWTILGDLSEFDVSFKCFCRPDSVFSHGSLHWCIKSAGNNQQHEILAFDVTNESFRKITFPYAINTSHRLFTVDDKSTIALVETIAWNVIGSAIQIWVMNEYGNTDSWTKRWLITHLGNFAATLCFVDQDKILLDLRPVGLISYDLSKGQFGDETPIRRAVFDFRPLISCHESFVSLKQLS